MIRPVKTYSKISTTFGSTAAPDSLSHPHKGIDFVCPVGTPVYAPISGKVTLSTYGTGGGNQIEIKDSQYAHRVLHLSKRLVSTNDTVKEGQLIGYSGNTGAQTTGPHVHWDVRIAAVKWDAGFSYYRNPEAVLKAANTPKPAPKKTVVDKQINLPANSGTWHLYHENGPYNHSAGKWITILHPETSKTGYTYPIVADKGNGIYVIKSPKWGRGALFTNGSKFVIK